MRQNIASTTTLLQITSISSIDKDCMTAEIRRRCARIISNSWVIVPCTLRKTINHGVLPGPLSLILPPSLLFTWVTHRQWCFSFLKCFAEISSSILSRQQRLVEFFNGPPGSVLADCKRKAAHVLNVRLFGMVRRIALWSICIFALFAQQTWTYIRLYCKAFLGIKI